MRITREKFNEELAKRGLEQRDMVGLYSAEFKIKGLGSKLSQQGNKFTVWCSSTVVSFFALYDVGYFDNA